MLGLRQAQPPENAMGFDRLSHRKMQWASTGSATGRMLGASTGSATGEMQWASTGSATGKRQWASTGSAAEKMPWASTGSANGIFISSGADHWQGDCECGTLGRG
ncbi:MAG: hypothetical protein ACKO16_00355 [Gemmataceae bacterium]